jgi:tRNA (cmo5U34)-methyltransferase
MQTWKFDAKVTACFADMLARSIPDYETMRGIVLDLGSRYVQPLTNIVDLGCSRGEALAPFIERFSTQNYYLGYEHSRPMLRAAQERFAKMPVVEIHPWDLREMVPNVWASLWLSVLTIQFVPVEFRPRIFREIHDRTLEGGAFILVEKVLGNDAETQRVLVEAYHDLKHRNGYRRKEIETKRRQLEQVLVPLPVATTETMLRAAGFRSVEMVWRAYNFAGWLCVKAEDAR